MILIPAIFFIFIAFCKGDQGEIEAYYEDAEEILPNRTYYWKNWCFRQERTGYLYLYIWSEAAALRFWEYSPGCAEFFINDESYYICYSYDQHSPSRHDIDIENELLQPIRRMIKSTTHTQPILSHASSTRLRFRNWYLNSNSEGEMTIQHTQNPLVVTLQEDFAGITIESNCKKETISATTLMGAEFSTSWIPGRKSNQSSPKAEALKPKTEQQSNLTSCCMLNRNNSDNGCTEIQCHTKAHLHNITYKWTIDSFDLHRPVNQMGKILRSPSFSSTTYDKIKFYLQITPGNITSDKISLFLIRSPNSTESEALAYTSINFLDSKGNLMYTLEWKWFYVICPENTDARGWYEIPINEVVAPDNTLNIVCKIAICEFTTEEFYLNNTDISMNSENDRSQNIVHPSTKNSQFPDVVLVLAKTGKEYPANKSVLAASSPVFATMFNINRTEKGEKIDRVNITDVDSEPVMDELLKYIYTSKCENIETLAHDLLIVANKYKLDNLTELCIEKISNTLTVENVVDTLNLADKHGFEKLKTNTIRFIAANYAQVSNTSGWKHIVKTKNGEFFHQVLLSNQSSKKVINEV